MEGWQSLDLYAWWSLAASRKFAWTVSSISGMNGQPAAAAVGVVGSLGTAASFASPLGVGNHALAPRVKSILATSNRVVDRNASLAHGPAGLAAMLLGLSRRRGLEMWRKLARAAMALWFSWADVTHSTQSTACLKSGVRGALVTGSVMVGRCSANARC